MLPTESAISSKASEPVAGPHAGSGEDIGTRWRRVLWIVVCLEVGIFLLLIPWSPLWMQNLLLGYYPALRPLYMNAYVRGAVSGLGLINLWLAFRQAWDFRRPTEAVESDE